jgi:hypothetical protein
MLVSKGRRLDPAAMTSWRSSRQRFRNFEAFAIGQSEAAAIGVLGFRFGVRGFYFGPAARRTSSAPLTQVGRPPAFSILRQMSLPSGAT